MQAATQDAAEALDLLDLRQEIRRLSRTNTLTSVYHIAEVWGVIAIAIYTSAVLVPPSSGLLGVVVYLGMVAVIAARQHALMVLTHDGIHKRLSRTLWILPIPPRANSLRTT